MPIIKKERDATEKKLNKSNGANLKNNTNRRVIALQKYRPLKLGFNSTSQI